MKTFNENTLYIFTVWQTKNQKYMFMPWDYAVKHFNINDYKQVAMGSFSGNGQTENELLNKIYESGNIGEIRANNPHMRSISVSDIIRFGGRYYYVDQIGFRDITEQVKE